MGRQITVIEPAREDDLTTKGPASICLEGPPQQQCYTAPPDFGNDPTATLVHVAKNKSAILFSAASRGVSGASIHFALLQPGTANLLQDMFTSALSLSNLGTHALWNEPTISDATIFLTADYVWGPDESHYSEHRYVISAYLLKSSNLLDDPYYFLEDQFMTIRKYDPESNAKILVAEKQEILSRLRHLKLDSDRRQRSTTPKPKSP